eukprot:gnl/MRDRNA2_/MRDRNA2_29271_c0_seq1.p1 gnl/MRDRNA2_/MRDRNA2_29271_c0~~gnl/MRDRNA2_/MRDRNA2_29271_c0_seq1.p1  ORF type:complete len:303 (+),score=49.93 gnl/MRDRNA2_/MRDRNA2_29271_c0_seq1:80-988(+)
MQSVQQNEASIQVQPSESNEVIRHFWVATLAEKFKMCEGSTTSIRDLKRRIQDRMALEGAVCLMGEGSDKELPSSMTLSELANDTTLICLVRGIEALESQLSNLPSPGCQIQKYLGWLDGVPAGDERVLQSLWFLSVLSNPAQSIEEEEDIALCRVKGNELVDEVNAAVFLGLDNLWNSGSTPGLDETFTSGDGGVPALSREATATLNLGLKLGEHLGTLQWRQIRHALEPHYRLTAHIRLLEWILEEGSPRLRVTMAEVNQVLVRGVQNFVTNHRVNARQTQSYKELLAIANCSQNVRCWA